jgi:SAM-dependent methyltransferase
VSRGVDGLTVEELRSSRAFWDDRYTRELLDGIPAAAKSLVDVGCGLARAAHELLPHRSELQYTGVDIDRDRLAQAGRELAAAPFASRARLLRCKAERLPLADGAADAVLATVVLQHVADPGGVLGEARRVLASGGVLVSVEPDYAPQQFYFDEPLDDVRSAFATLRAACRAAKRPADHNIGPRVASLLRAAGFGNVIARVHCLQGSDHARAATIAADLLEMADILAASAGASAEAAARQCRTSVAAWLRDVGANTMGQYAWFVPVFVTRGQR